MSTAYAKSQTNTLATASAEKINKQSTTNSVEVSPTVTFRPAVDVPLSQLSDEQLLLKYQQTRDAELFEELEQRYRRELLGYLRRYVGEHELAEDVLQATLFKVYLNCDRYEAGRRVRPWLFKIATNQAIDSLRRKRRRQLPSLNAPMGAGDEDTLTLDKLVIDPAPWPSQAADALEQRALSRESVNCLPENLKEAVNEVYLEGRTFREAAEVLSLPLGTLKSRVHRALGELRQQWNRPRPLPTTSYRNAVA